MKTQFDPNNPLALIKDKIKDAYVSLIPEEQWDEMVKREIDEYFKITETNTYNNNRLSTSNFRRDVVSVLQEETIKRTKEYLDRNFNIVWDSNGIPKCNELIEEMITKNSGKILSNMIGDIVTNAIRNASYQI